MSCDGRTRKYQSNQDVLKSANLYKSFSKKISFIPETRHEIVTDTILSSGFEIKLKYNAIENDFISKISQQNKDLVTETNYKNFEAELEISKLGKLITHKLINKNLFKKLENTAFLENAVMQHVWVDYINSSDNQIQLNTSFRVVGTNNFKDFSILINSLGTIEIKEINLRSNTI